MVGRSAQQALVVRVTAHDPVQDHQVGRVDQGGVGAAAGDDHVLDAGPVG